MLVAEEPEAGVVDPRVVLAKVGREFDSWERNAEAYRRRGWLMFSRNGVVIDIGFMGAVPLGNTALDLVTAVVRFDYSDFDVRPPSLRFIDPRTGVDRVPVVRALTPTPEGPRDLLLNEHPVHNRAFQEERLI